MPASPDNTSVPAWCALKPICSLLMAQCRMDENSTPTGHEQTAGSAPGRLLTAVDLGSNSFYLMQARVVGDRLSVVRGMRKSVRLVAGVDSAGALDPETLARALSCLQQFGSICRAVPADTIRVVATSAVRRLAQPQEFLQQASHALGQAVEIIDGQTEGELIWRGANAALPASAERRLMIDVGGGSTECIVGREMQPLHVASVDIGCIVSCRQYFDDGCITAGRWQRARAGLRDQITPHRQALSDHGWDKVWATSGAARIIGNTVQALGLTDNGISAAAIDALRQRLLEAGHVSRIHLPGLDRSGAQLAAGTVAVLEALFQTLGIEHMQLCESAMREGIIRELALRQASGSA